jgi:hypothetical protein
METSRNEGIISTSYHEVSGLWGESPRYSLDRGMRGPENRFGHSGERKNLLPQQGIELRFLYL